MEQDRGMEDVGLVRKWARALWTSFLGGALFMLPIIIVVLLGEKGFEILKRLTHPLLQFFPDVRLPGIAFATLLELGAFAVLCVLAGWFAGTGKGSRFYRWIERYLLNFIPGYSMIRSSLYDLVGKEEETKIPIVLARIEDAWQLAFLIETLPSGVLAVYVPGVPSIRSGDLYFLTEDRIQRTQIPFWKARVILRRFGIGSAAALKDIL